jgi:hypothetical protein
VKDEDVLSRFADRNLRLAVLNELMGSGRLPRFDLEAFHVAKTGEPWNDLDEYNYEYRESVARALLDLSAAAEQCADIRKIFWEAGGGVQELIWYHWDGESDEFYVRSLAGIGGVVPALESLEIWMGNVTDLAPLAECRRLRRLVLQSLDPVQDLAPLAGLALEYLSLVIAADTDLAPLAAMPLTELDLGISFEDDRKVSVDLRPLTEIPTLRKVHLQPSSILDPPGNRDVVQTLVNRDLICKVNA